MSGVFAALPLKVPAIVVKGNEPGKCAKWDRIGWVQGGSSFFGG